MISNFLMFLFLYIPNCILIHIVLHGPNNMLSHIFLSMLEYLLLHIDIKMPVWLRLCIRLDVLFNPSLFDLKFRVSSTVSLWIVAIQGVERCVDLRQYYLCE